MKASHPHEKPHHPHAALAFLLFSFVFLLGIFSIHDAATWLHLRVGREIWETHSIPRRDFVSYTVFGRPWTTDSWLADVALFGADRLWRPWGPALLKSGAAAAAFALLLPLNPGSPLIGAGVLALGATASWAGFTETPAVFDLLILALMVRLMRPRKTFDWGLAARAGLLELVWSNLHATVAVLGLWLAALKALKAFLSVDKKRFFRPLLPLAAVGAGFALNPSGLRPIVDILSQGGFGTFGRSAPWQELPASWVLYAVFFLLGAWGAFVCLQQEFFLSVSAGTLLGFGLFWPGVRPLAILCACPVIALALGHFIRPWGETPGRLAAWTGVAAALFGGYWFWVYKPLAPAGGYGSLSLGGAIAFLEERGVSGHLFNEPEAGDMIAGQSLRPVFVDTRAGLYDLPFMSDAQRWTGLFPSLADIYHFDYAVILNRRGLYSGRIFDESPDWRLAYADDAALVYLRASGDDKDYASRLPVNLLSPNRLWPDALDGPLADSRLREEVLRQLDAWSLQAPRAIQPLLWKAYVLERIGRGAEARSIGSVAEADSALWDSPELVAELAFLYEGRGERDAARRLYSAAASLSGHRGNEALEAAISLRLSALASR